MQIAQILTTLGNETTTSTAGNTFCYYLEASQQFETVIPNIVSM